MLTTPTTSTNGVQPPSVRLPGKPVDPDGADLAAPIAGLLRELGVLETKEDAEKGVSVTGTPQSLQVITAGVLAATKASTVVTGSGGLLATIGAAVSSYLAESVALKAALLGGAAIVLAATVLAIAIIVKGDVSGRAATTVAQYEARAAIAQATLRAYAPISAPASGAAPAGAAAASNGSVPVTPALLAALSSQPTAVLAGGSPSFVQVTGLRYGDEGLQLRRADGDWIGVERVTQFQPA